MQIQQLSSIVETQKLKLLEEVKTHTYFLIRAQNWDLLVQDWHFNSWLSLTKEREKRQLFEKLNSSTSKLATTNQEILRQQLNLVDQAKLDAKCANYEMRLAASERENLELSKMGDQLQKKIDVLEETITLHQQVSSISVPVWSVDPPFSDSVSLMN